MMILVYFHNLSFEIPNSDLLLLSVKIIVLVTFINIVTLSDLNDYVGIKLYRVDLDTHFKL